LAFIESKLTLVVVGQDSHQAECPFIRSSVRALKQCYSSLVIGFRLYLIFKPCGRTRWDWQHNFFTGWMLSCHDNNKSKHRRKYVCLFCN